MKSVWSIVYIEGSQFQKIFLCRSDSEHPAFYLAKVQVSGLSGPQRANYSTWFTKFVVFVIYNETSEYISDYAKKTYIVYIKLIWQVNWTILGINIDNIGVPAISKK